MRALCIVVLIIAGCDPPAPAWVQASCALMVGKQYPSQQACLTAAKRERVY
jgi:hypothetical protein